MEDYNKKFEEYMAIYHEYFLEDIFDKGYRVTLFRDLIIYFCYQENKLNNNKKITLKFLATQFHKRDHTAIVKSLNRTKELIDRHDFIRYMYGSDVAQAYFNIFYRYNIILTKKNK